MPHYYVTSEWIDGYYAGKADNIVPLIAVDTFSYASMPLHAAAADARYQGYGHAATATTVLAYALNLLCNQACIASPAATRAAWVVWLHGRFSPPAPPTAQAL